jgi:predicted O-methyltransferase YrrM
MNRINVCEVGLAYGTSSLVILNELIKIDLPATYTVIDPNQKREWTGVGDRNVRRFLHKYDTKGLVDYRLMEEPSVDAVPKLPDSFYDVVFIDGSHETEDVLHDLRNAHRVLKPGGVILLDDVKHHTVAAALHRFLKLQPTYSRVCVSPRTGRLSTKVDYDRYNNPNTMYAYVKPNNMYSSSFQKKKKTGHTTMRGFRRIKSMQ